MKKEFLLTIATGLLYSSTALTQTCTTPPSCDTLGFNKTAADCEGQSALKCPFDQSKLYCPDANAMANTAPGAIYYSDGTISDSVIPGKTPVGVVAYVNGSNGFVVALEESSKTWGGYGSNVSCLTDYSSSMAQTDMNGKTNTQCLISDTQSHPAAEYCNSFKPVSSGKGSSGWYLPAAGELYLMSFSYGAINLGLQKLSKTKISSSVYWSSSENRNSNYAWVVNPSDGGMADDLKNYAGQVRCVLAL